MKQAFVSHGKQQNPVEASRQEIQFACFRVGEVFYAIDILRIKEIIRPLKLTPLPKAPKFVEGVINLRGTVIPVVDLRKRFSLEFLEHDRKTRVIICAVGGKILGLTVDEVLEVKRFTRQDMQPAPQFVKSGEAEFFLGVCRRGDDLVLVLDLERLLTSEEQCSLTPLSGDRQPDLKS